jgi:hypothetical protein
MGRMGDGEKGWMEDKSYCSVKNRRQKRRSQSGVIKMNIPGIIPFLGSLIAGRL